MATFRKRNKKWQAIVRHKDIGTTTRSFISKANALRWVKEQEEKLETGVYGRLEPSRVTLGDLLKRYSQEITPAKRGAETEQRRLQRLIRDPLSLLTVDQLNSPVIAGFRDHRLQDGTRACQYDLVLIRHCLNIAINEWGLMLASNPVDRVKMPPSSPARQRRLEVGEFEKLKAVSGGTRNPHIWPIIVFAIETGMRRSEILGLTWDNTDLERRIAFLPITKNGSSREVPLSARALAVLRQQQSKKVVRPFPVKANAFRLAWDRLRARAGLVDFKFHDLRHEALSRFFEMGLSIPEVALISGHRDVKMLMRYTHLRAEDLVKKIS
ncbi:MAG: site-specific integrase [Alphaproteobacteria bacterium]|nr:site-specific integrase [Alphaproteobacteria bacterium]